MNKKKLILFDIDYTLYDTAHYKNTLFKHMAKKLKYPDMQSFIRGAHKVYNAMRKNGQINLDFFTQELIRKFDLTVDQDFLIECMFSNEVLSTSLYDEANQVIPLIHAKKDYILGVFSAGVTQHQHAKIGKIKEYFDWDYVHVFPVDKKLQLPKVLKKYSSFEMYIVDDLLDVLYTAKQVNPKITTIWSKRGFHKDDTDLLSIGTPDYIIEDLRELLDILT